MRNMFYLLKGLYRTNKLLLVLVMIALLVFVIGCSSQGGGYSAPSGPVGGGCS